MKNGQFCGVFFIKKKTSILMLEARTKHEKKHKCVIFSSGREAVEKRGKSTNMLYVEQVENRRRTGENKHKNASP